VDNIEQTAGRDSAEMSMQLFRFYLPPQIGNDRGHCERRGRPCKANRLSRAHLPCWRLPGIEGLVYETPPQPPSTSPSGRVLGERDNNEREP